MLARTTALALLALLSAACATGGASIRVLGGSDAPHRELVEHVHAAGAEACAAHADFRAAFELYQRLTAPQAVELEALSEQFEAALEECHDHAEELAERLEGARREHEALLEGWNAELARFSGETLRGKSEAMLQDTEARSQHVLAALERAQGSLQPVLLKLQDYALFFHHNLNARAIATLQDTYKGFDAEFRVLEGEFLRAEREVAGFLAAFVEPEPAAGPPQPSDAAR